MRIDKKIITVVLIIFLLFIFTTSIFAKVNMDNIVDDDSSVQGTAEIKKIGSYIYSGLTSVGMVLAVVVIAILGVKYMMGSAEEKAEYKKSMIPYLIGALLVFAASTIAKAVIGIVE